MENNKQLIIEINENLHKQLKARALNNNMTLKMWVLSAILEKIKNEKQYE